MDAIKNTSESEQMYLVAIARLGEIADECPIPVTKVAELLEVTPISANQMIHQLEDMGFIQYTPYRGVEFTRAGWDITNQIMRLRRLWEVFLYEHLKYSPVEAETLACRLEHAIPAETAERLAGFLGNPKVSPKGKPIPQKEGAVIQNKGVPLSSLPAGKTAVVSALVTGDTEAGFFEQVGIGQGSKIKMLAIADHGICLVETPSAKVLSISAELSPKVLVIPVEETDYA